MNFHQLTVHHFSWNWMRNTPIRPVDFVGTSMAFQDTMNSTQTVSFINKNWFLESPACFFSILLTLVSPVFLFPTLLNDLPRRHDSISVEKYFLYAIV